MAKVTVRCSNSPCTAQYTVDDSNLGKTAACKKCGTEFKVALADAPPAANGERPRGEDGIPRDWEPGDVILDLYEVMKLPGTKDGYAEGGMGRVNLVRHREWNRDLAVKSVLPAKSASARDIENFTTEAEQWVDTIGLHPNIVACHYVRVLGGVPRVFIEYVDGGSLQEWITSKRLYEGGPKAALERILDVAIQTAWGLHYVHELGLIHQDVKPLNVMMTADGVAKVTDFGLAGAKAIASGEVEHGPAGQTLLATGAGIMTPTFCSPEQADIMAMKKGGTPSERWPKLTRRTDIWSWAVSVLHMFLGKIAWPGGQVAHLGLQREPDEPHLPPMPTTVKDLLRPCFQKLPDDRPHDLMQVADALQTIYQQVTGQPYPREQPKPDELLADSFNNRAVSLFELGKHSEAEQKWQEALRVDPYHPEATYNWGLIQWRSLQMTDQQLLDKLRAVRTSSAAAARVDYLLGLVQLERTDAQAAIQQLREAVEVGTSRPEITSALALAQSMVDPSEQFPRTFKGHTGKVTSVSWSPDGRCALSGSEDKTLRLWEVSRGKCRRNTIHRLWNGLRRFALWQLFSGQCLRTFTGHTEAVTSVSWSPDGRYALSGSQDMTLRLWEVSSGKCLRTFEGHMGYVTSLSWSPDGRFALSGDQDIRERGLEIADQGEYGRSAARLRLWEVSSGKCLPFNGITCSVTSVSWSPNGRFALSATGYSVDVWEVPSGKFLRSFKGHTDSVTSVSWSPKGRYALSGSDDKTLRLWEVSSGKCFRIFKGHDGHVTSVSLSPDGRYALSGHAEGVGDNWAPRVRLWEVSSGRCLRTFVKFGVPSVSWSPDGRYILLGGDGLELWGIAITKQPVPLVTSRSFPVSSALYLHLLKQARESVNSNPAIAAGFLHQARQLPGCSRRPDALELTRLLSHSLVHRRFVEGWKKRTFEGHRNSVRSVSWSPDGRDALSGSDDNSLCLWEVSSGKCLRTFEGHTGDVTSVSWSPDGRYALSGSHDMTLRLWEVSSGKCLRTFEGHTHEVTSVSWSPDGRYTLSGSFDKTLRLWEVSSGKCLRTFKGHKGIVESVSWSPDGRFALSGSWDKTLRLWEVSSGTCLRTFKGHSNWVTSVSWSPDGRFALSGSIDETLRLWAVSSRKCLRTTFRRLWNGLCRLAPWQLLRGQALRSFKGHTSPVYSVSWSPDGRYALSGSSDAEMRLWEVSSGKCLRTFKGHTSHVYSVSWSPDGCSALSGSVDKTLRLWELDWEFELNEPADWHEGTRPFLNAFLTIQTPYAVGLVRGGKPTWTEDDFRRLLDILGCAGYGWLRPEGVHDELQKMAATWQGPPPLD